MRMQTTIKATQVLDKVNRYQDGVTKNHFTVIQNLRRSLQKELL